MSLVKAQRVTLDGYKTRGQQTVTGTLTVSGPTVVELDPSVYYEKGTYILFQYGIFNNAQLSNIQIDASGTGFAVLEGPVNVVSKNLITVALG